jgi:cyclophilin family peptidyl-prolyl cis-trans isomerase
MDTTQGKVVIALRPDLAPKHVERIKKLVREGFYDGIVFHRVIDGFMAQTGCPKGTGTGGSKYPNLPAEFNAEPHVRGVCSMARSQSPDSANSQFFICFDDARFLDKQYTVWGKVIEGMDVVDKIKRGEPVANPDKMTSLKVAADVKAGRMGTIIGYTSALAPYRPFYSNNYQWFYAQDGAFTGFLADLHANNRLDIWSGMTFGANTFFTLRSNNSYCYIGQVNYWTSDEWRAALSEIGLTAKTWITQLDLYPKGVRWVFDRSLHFMAVLPVPEK